MHVPAPRVSAVLRGAARLPGGFAILAVLAALADAARIEPPGAFASVRWLEFAALAALVAAAVARRRDPAAWTTPLDGRVAGMLAVLLLAAFGGGASAGLADLRVVLAGLACFYALSALVSKRPLAFESAWGVFPVASLAMGLHALWAATSGLAHVARTSAAADLGWGAPGALVPALAFATLLTIGRALERGAEPAGRLAAIVGAAGVGVHLAASGSPFDARAFGRLESPLEFSSAVVVALVLHWLGRTAWAMRCERRGEAGRWWGALAGNSLLGAWLVFGSGPPGEGLALLAAFAAALIAAAPAVPPARAGVPAEEAPEPLRRAA